MTKNTAIIGASSKPERYAYLATLSLLKHGHKVFPIGLREGMIGNEFILTNRPQLADIDTVTLYVGPQHQEVWADYIFSLKPKRLIFNPGTENPVLLQEAEKRGIECVEACTLVMLSIGNY
ncbi:MAG: CoA-binding protein [bacterium]|nr:CoA-binding protein [bacterium]